MNINLGCKITSNWMLCTLINYRGDVVGLFFLLAKSFSLLGGLVKVCCIFFCSK